ncbi:hypothetical protein B0H13DRAFT_2302324 [Mycena leptocephala]|nr:hypothetical protein B0H13DRAFT_2302324 [Mycena leptocephala]
MAYDINGPSWSSAFGTGIYGHLRPDPYQCHLTLNLVLLSEPIPAIPPLLHLRSLYVWSFEGDPESPHPQHLFQALTLPALEVLSAFEPYLGPDPVATIFALRPREYPQRIEIFTVRTTSDVAPRDIYAAAFPETELIVELAY